MKNPETRLPFKTFPFQTSLSFVPLIRYWETKINDDNRGISLFAKAITKQLEKSPELRKPIQDPSFLKDHEDLIEIIMTAVFPPATWETDISGALTPFLNSSFYQTPKFREIFISENDKLKRPLNLDKQKMLYLNIRQAFLFILNKCYHIPVPVEEALIFTVPDYALGLYRHYRVSLNNSFLQVKHNGPLPPLSATDIRLLLTNMENLELWRQYILPDNFAFEGFYVMELVDVTEQETLSSIKLDLLEKDVLTAPDRFEQLQEKIRIFFNRPHLQLGLAAFNNRKKTFVNFGRKINHSFLIPQTDASTNSVTFKAVYDKLLEDGDPLVVEDVETASLPEGVGAEISNIGIRSIILALLRYQNQVFGIIELGSPFAGDLNSFSLARMQQFLPHFEAAVKRNAEDLESRIQGVIKEKFTAIHPVMEWRFKEAALNLLELQESGLQPEIEPIVFQDVYPLFAVSDIRSSSTERNKAIQGDLIEHLRMVEKVLKKAIDLQALPILEELKFYITKSLRKLRRGVLSEDEAAIFEVIKTHVEPIFEYLKSHNPSLQSVIQAYYAAMDPQLGVLYKRRKDFETSLTLINETISDYLEAEEAKAQQMYPHYFEKYKTDGVEFNIYVGASIAENRPFDLVFLRNLRLWQLMTVCGIARKAAELKPSLPMPLETTQLILIYSQPLAIRFRRDERKFDVDGAYNIRYEIIKKRIDKATVVGTRERLTQPGTIAIVYSQGREANEYKDYIDYLQNINLLTREVEYLDLEEMQGVSGLKAIRVKVKFDESN
ncbi:GAF domain-containing protein [Adhaeribacter rhizoryzae]|uniref:GAF domain-containing protein n=1 Tax=Adhaeribacter rhizoryzae TaxID=2607907 RepID=A0A5M6DL13_9BACT|nr:GAF domain-containing protein [Adhaeribacter rhizoryzae]KAA5548237.1 GAF domain-containing protein [Adhaeribacter rhizoryzae]